MDEKICLLKKKTISLVVCVMRKKSKKRPEHEGQQLAQTSGYPVVKLLFK